MGHETIQLLPARNQEADEGRQDAFSNPERYSPTEQLQSAETPTMVYMTPFGVRLAMRLSNMRLEIPVQVSRSMSPKATMVQGQVDQQNAPDDDPPDGM